MKRPLLLNLSLFCWGIPFALGLISLLGFWITRNNFFQELGFSSIVIGFFLTIIGYALLSILKSKIKKQIEETPQPLKKKIYFVRNLLILNIPIAVTFLIIGIYLIGTVCLEIHNLSSETIHIRVTQAENFTQESLDLKPNEKISTLFSSRENSLDIEVNSSKGFSTKRISEYATGNSNDSKITITENLQIEVEKLHN